MPQTQSHQTARAWLSLALAFAGVCSLQASDLIPVGSPTLLEGPGAVAASTSTSQGELEVVSVADDASLDGVFARLYSPAGLPLGPREPLNQATSGFQFRPAVAALVPSGFVATWETAFPIFFPFSSSSAPLQVGDAYSISARVLDEHGVPQGAEMRLNSELAPGTNAQVAALTSGGFVASWIRITDPAGLVYRIFDSSGAPQTAERLITKGGMAANVGLARLPDGGFAAAWNQGGQGLFVQCFGAHGSPVAAPAMVADGYGGVPAFVAANDQGNLVIAWMSAFSTSQSLASVHVVRLDGTGTPLWPAITVAETNLDGKPVLGGVDIDAAGRFTVSFSRALGSTTQAYAGDAFAQLFDSSGARQGDAIGLNGRTDGVQAAGAVHAARDGVWRVLWKDDFNGTDWVQRIRAGDCLQDSSDLCVQGRRFRLAVSFRDPRNGQRAAARPWELTNDSGSFSFFGNGNIELVVKVLDGRAVNGRFWVFYGGLSDVEYDITVTDTLTGDQRVYHNAAGTLASKADTRAFPLSGPTTATREPARAAEQMTRGIDLAGATTSTDCANAPASLCLGAGRFSLNVAWHDVRSGASGAGHAIPLTGESGYFWFFGPGNVELVVKVLDGTPVNGHVWVFYASLTDVEFDLTVIDNSSTPPTKRVYHNRAGNLASNADVTAF